MDYDDLIRGFSGFGLSSSTNARPAEIKLPQSVSTALGKGVEAYYRSRRPSSAVLEARRTTIERVSSTLRNHSTSKFSVVCVGSTIVGHDSATSDLDLIILDSDRPTGLASYETTYGLPSPYNMIWLAGILREGGFSNVEAVSSAAVPIVKFEDPRSSLKMDLNCNSRLGVTVTRLFEKYCALYSGLRPMIFVIKKWAGRHNLNNPTVSSAGRFNVSLSSYCYVLMIIAYLQKKGALPNLQSPDRLASIPSSEFWIQDRYRGRVRCDTRIGNSEGFRGSGLSLGDAMYGWFRYFADEYRYGFDCLSIHHGGNLPRTHTERSGLKVSQLIVQDPFIIGKNVSGNCGDGVIQRFQDECRLAATSLKDGASIESLLQRSSSSALGSSSYTSRYRTLATRPAFGF